MKALTIKQPWASLICYGIKDIENRTWKTNFRGRVYIHSSSPRKFTIHLNDEQTKLAAPVLKMAFDGIMPFGAIIGEVDIIDCVINHPSIWAEKTKEHLLYEEPATGKMTPYHSRGIGAVYNWVLANPVIYDKPILNVKGKLSFWEYYPPANEAFKKLREAIGDYWDREDLNK